MPQDGLRSQGERRGRGTRPGSVYIKCSEDEEEKETKKEWLVRSEWNEERSIWETKQRKQFKKK